MRIQVLQPYYVTPILGVLVVVGINLKYSYLRFLDSSITMVTKLGSALDYHAQPGG